MAELVKPWNDGGSLSVAYEGDGDGSAVFSSDAYEGIDREQIVVFRDGGKSVAIERTVRQEGTRQPIGLAGGGIFRLANGGRFGVLKEGGVEPPTPPTPVEVYTSLAYIEATGEQYFNLNYIVKETDTIEVMYFSTANANGEKMLFGAMDSNGSVSASISSTSGVIRFGTNTNTSVARVYYRYKIVLKKGSLVNGTASAAPGFSAMPELPIYLFARNNNGTAGNFGKHRCFYFRITDADGNVVVNLRPVKNSAGVIGMLDEIDGTFYSSESGVEFVSDFEARMPSGYKVLDKLTFNKDKLFETGLYINDSHTIETLMHNGAPVATAKYMYGVLSTGNKESCTAYLASNGTWRFGASYRSINTADNDDHYMVQDVNSVSKDRTRYATNNAGSVFTTAYTLPVGGSISAAGAYSRGFFGDIFFITIREGDSTLLYWIPVCRDDGVEGFWDCVSQKFIEPF